MRDLKTNYNKTKYMPIGREDLNTNLEKMPIQNTNIYLNVTTEVVDNRIQSGKTARKCKKKAKLKNIRKNRYLV